MELEARKHLHNSFAVFNPALTLKFVFVWDKYFDSYSPSQDTEFNMASYESRYDNGREAVISGANLLLVALLKLNRALVPVILRNIRSSRLNWIHNASRDVLHDLIHRPGERVLCMGDCCLSTYEMFPTASRSEQQSEGTTARSGGTERQVNKTSTDVHVGGTVTETQPLLADRSSINNNDREHAMASLVPNYAIELMYRERDGTMSHGERYYRLLAQQEERHRTQRAIPAVYESVVSAWLTIGSLIIYSVCIVFLVIKSFPMTKREALIFAFSLVSTATVSEADKLLQVVKRNKNYTLNTLSEQGPQMPSLMTDPINDARKSQGISPADVPLVRTYSTSSRFRNRVEQGESSDLDDM